jgi:NADPH:quinone reductase-like Zn-dependent oxidoreductase
VIEAIGPEVAGLETGDPVYGMNDWFSDGAAAEYCVAVPVGIAPKPAALDHLHAAAVPISGLTAWQAVFERGNLEAGQSVLIHGGAGGVGSIAIQLAVWKGAFVATTVSEANIEFVRTLGAHQPIDPGTVQVMASRKWAKMPRRSRCRKAWSICWTIRTLSSALRGEELLFWA